MISVDFDIAHRLPQDHFYEIDEPLKLSRLQSKESRLPQGQLMQQSQAIAAERGKEPKGREDLLFSWQDFGSDMPNCVPEYFS